MKFDRAIMDAEPRWNSLHLISSRTIIKCGLVNRLGKYGVPKAKKVKI